MKPVFRMTGIVLAIFVIGFLAYSAVYTRVPDSRLAVAEAIAGTAPLREQIAARIGFSEKVEGVGQGMKPPALLTTRYGTVAVSVSPNGAIRMKSEKPVFDVELVASKDATGVVWRCRGTPEDALPRTCRT